MVWLRKPWDVEVCMTLYALADVISCFRQVRHNKAKKSIYGLSFDYVLLDTVSFITSVICTYNYMFNLPIKIHYARKRFLYSPSIRVVPSVMVLDCIHAVLSLAVLWQLVITYRRTRSIDQSFSWLCLGLLGLLGAMFIWVFDKASRKKASIFPLDVVDFVWFVSKTTAALKTIPQAQVNTFGSCVVGLHDYWLTLQWTSLMLLAVSKICVSKKFKFIIVPVNLETWVYLGINTLVIAVITAQKWKFFKGNRPTVEMYYQEEQEQQYDQDQDHDHESEQINV